MNIYQQNILDHYQNPRNFGHLEKPDASFELANSLCGDKIGMEIKIKSKIKNQKSEIISEIKFYGEGCAISQASASMLTEKAKNMKPEEIRELKYDDIKKMLGIELSPARIKCATLPLEVLQKAVSLV